MATSFDPKKVILQTTIEGLEIRLRKAWKEWTEAMTPEAKEVYADEIRKLKGSIGKLRASGYARDRD